MEVEIVEGRLSQWDVDGVRGYEDGLFSVGGCRSDRGKDESHNGQKG